MIAWVGDASGRGEFSAAPRIDARDRGLTLGLALFETMRGRGGRVPLWDRHLRRLGDSAAVLGLPLPDEAALREVAIGVLARAGRDDVVLRLTLTADARCAIVCREFAASPAPRRLAVVPLRRDAGDPTAAHKSTSRLLLVIAQRLAREAGADEALLRGADGELLETDVGNLFCELDGRWLTPPTDGRLLPGVARGVLLEGLAAAGQPGLERPLVVADLTRVQRLVVSNAVHGPRPAQIQGSGPAAAGTGLLGPLWRAALG